MAKLKEELWKTLHDLKEEEFENFKWFLKEDGILEGLSGIPVYQLEKAKRQDTVDLMVQKYPGPGALKVTLKILGNIDRNDLVQRLQNFRLEPRNGAKKEEYKGEKPKLQWVQQFAVDVTLDPDTAHPHLILSADGKQVRHGDVRKKLPNNPERFHRCVNILGKQSFSSGKFYYEVQVKGKTAWALGVAKESIKRKVQITANPQNGYWTIMLTNEDVYEANDDDPVCLSLNQPPQKVGVFVDIDEGLVCFYDVDSADLIHSFTGCSFTEKLYPFFTPFTNDGGVNSAPLIISPVNQEINDTGDQKELERKAPELKSAQQFAVDVTLDPDTAHPHLIMSRDGKQVRHGDVKKKLPDNPERFKKCVSILGKPGFASGKFYFEVQVKGKTAWDLGVAEQSVKRKIQITTSPQHGYWTIVLRNENDYEAIDDDPVCLSLNQPPQKVGVFVDIDEGLVCFYDVDSADLIHSFTGCSFTGKLYPYFSPCTNDGGVNSAPLIISPVNQETNDTGDQKELERKAPELKSVQQFAVDVTLDPDTAHPHLILSRDGKQVRHGDVKQKLPDNPERFKKCVSILGKPGFASGKFYFEVQVKGKTAWDLGVAEQSVKRKIKITTSPQHGYWTIRLRNENDYEANDDDPVCLSLNQPPQKVGVFVNYDEGLVCFYDVDSADLLHSFTGCYFTGKLYPYFSPCTNDGGVNSAPLIISPVNQETHDTGDQKELERKAPELKSVQQFAVDVTLDPDTANPHLILSDDGKQVHHSDVKKTLPNNPERFYSFVNVLGKQSFSSGKFYYEVQVKGKTAWALGVAKQSIKRKIKIAACPQHGYWTIMLTNKDVYEANDDDPVQLSLNHPLQKVGVFVDYDEDLVCFYDVDSADLIYSFTGCSFTEKLYPFFSPCTNDGGTNSAPLIISPVNEPLSLKMHDLDCQTEEHEKKKAELKSLQQFAVDVTLDPDTAHCALFLSADGKQVHDGDVLKELPDNPERFNRCVNVLGKQSFSSGKFYFEVQVKGKTAWTLGVAKESIQRKGRITLDPNNGFWTICLEDRDDYQAVDDPFVHLSLNHPPQKVGVFVNYDEGLVSFYDVDSADLLYCFTSCSFTEKLYPFFSPCTDDGGTNSAPLIICPVNDFSDQEEHERKKAELMSVQQFAVDVTLDPDTAHPHLILSDDGKQVHHSDVRNKLPDNPNRFDKRVNVLGKQSFSSGRFYFEVQVKGKTAWALGVAKQSIKRKIKIAACPQNGYWTIMLTNEDVYEANDDDPVCLSLNHPLQKVGVFVDYDKDLVCFYDVDSADLLYSFTSCSFTEKLLPYFSPCTNDNGTNSAPLIICPVSHSD